MADGYDPKKYNPANLSSWLTPQQYAQYQRLNAEFRGAFGSNFGDFNWAEYLANPQATDYQASTVRNSDPQSLANQQRRSQALANIKNFFSQVQEAPQQIDPTPYFDKARSEIGDLYDQQRIQATGDINRAFRGGENRATEALAGTGFGRSGVAVNEFQNLEGQRTSAEASALSSVETARLATEQKLAFDQMQFSLNQELLDQGWEKQMIDDALNFQRQMQLANFQAALQYEPSSWLETFGSLAEIGANIGLAFAGIGPVLG